MKTTMLLIIAAALLTNSQNARPADESNKTWANAQWIALEELEDSKKVVPAVHGSGDELGHKAVERSIVPLFRKEFQIAKEIENAAINICGLGHYELHVNGDKVGDRFLAPGWSLYQKRSLYNTYDITELIKMGDNALAVLVGNGFYNINRERYRKLIVAYGYPKLIFNISIQFRDGSVKNIVSDDQCTVAPSPITFSSIYGGEDYDARMEFNGWASAGFDDSSWQKPIVLGDSIKNLTPEKDYPLKVMQEFKTQNISTSKSGRTIYDFGQNASGIIALKVRGNKGTRICIRPDELLNNDGDVTQQSGGGPYEYNYTLKGEGIEEWRPRFTYYGFRYADVEIIEAKETDESTEIIELKMLHTRNSSPTVGSFSCSDTLFNQIFDLINWGIKSNMASVTTDCPHREKLGWLEQTYLIGPSMHFNYNIHSLYSKIVTDMMDSQLENGLVPDIAPEYVPFKGGFRDSPEWGSASVIIPWQMYKWYGDEDVVEKAYPMMKRYVGYLESKAQNNILDYGLGDWYDLGPRHPGEAQLTPKAVTATSIYFYDLQIIAGAATMLGFHEDVQKYSALSEKVQQAFLTKFYNPELGVCSTESQTAYAMPLYTGIIPKEDRTRVFNNLVAAIEKNDFALTSGDVGYYFLVRVLSEYGRSDILYKMNNRSDRPGYGYQLRMGATALTESWAALPTVSNNHMMLGHLMEWFYTGLGGIRQSASSVAYNDLIIAPNPVGDIQWVKCSYVSRKGLISSEWRIDEDAFLLNVEIPQDASATVILPDEYIGSSCSVRNTTTKIDTAFEIQDDGFVLTSGKYTIIAK